MAGTITTTQVNQQRFTPWTFNAGSGTTLAGPTDLYQPGNELAYQPVNYRQMLAATRSAPATTGFDGPSVSERRIAEIVADDNPVQRNRDITESYYQLSQDMREFLGPDAGANWATWASHASARAGQTIRREDIPLPVKLALMAAPGLGLSQGATERYIAGHVAEGNKKVFEEIAPVFSRFLDTFKDDTSFNQERLDSFLQTIPEDKPKLREAFELYYRAKFQARTPEQKQQMTLRANVLIGEHEQARLDSHIDAAMPYGTRTIITEYMMSLPLPRGEVDLSEDLPGRRGTGASDWSEYDQRMRMIEAMFTEYHTDPTLFQRPRN